MNQDQNKKIKENRVIDFLKSLIEKYKNYNGVNVFVIIICIILGLGILLSNSFILNLTYTGNITELKIPVYCSNFCILLVVLLFLYFVFGNIKISLILTMGLLFLIDIVNQIVYSVRGTAFAVADIFSLTTALTVTNGIKYEASYEVKKYVINFVLLILTLLGIKFRKKDKNNKKVNLIKRIISLFVCIVLFNISLNYGDYKTLNFWNIDETYRVNGVPISIVRQCLDFNINKPEGYSKEKAEEILLRYSGVKSNDEKINIITIINESFADVNRIYKLGLLESNIPFYDSLFENTIKGNVYSSTLGGGTATVEWEYLTGSSSLYIPSNSIPFISYLNNINYSLIDDLNKQNYYTFAVHPFFEKGYNRNFAYPEIGFMKSSFIEDMPDYKLINTIYPSDEYTYNKLIQEYESRDRNKNFFGYVLTMQNHIPYTKEEWAYESYGYVEDPELDEYLSEIRDSDLALEKLINYFKEDEEKVLILFFGDHQAGLDLEKNESRWLSEREVPYLLWANYDIEEKNEDYSTNFLSLLLYNYANLDTNSYVEFLKDFSSKIPVFTKFGYRDIYGKTYEIDDESSPYKEIIKEYQILQYYFMFDYKQNDL